MHPPNGGENKAKKILLTGEGITPERSEGIGVHHIHSNRMAYSWTFGAENSGLWFEIVRQNSGKTTLLLKEGSMDLNALWFSDGNDTSEKVSLSKKENSLNMEGEGSLLNGQAIKWNTYSKISDTGLKHREDDLFGNGGLIEASQERLDITEAFGKFETSDWGSAILGIRATSVNGEGSVKLASNAQSLNWGFEDQLTNWETIGSVNISEENSTEGEYSAEITTKLGSFSAEEVADFLGTTKAALEETTEVSLFEGSAIKTTIDVVTGETISFDYTWDSGEEYLPYNDTSLYVTQNGEATVTEITDVASGPLDSGTVSFTATKSGSLELGIGIFDAKDGILDSSLWIDNITVA